MSRSLGEQSQDTGASNSQAAQYGRQRSANSNANSFMPLHNFYIQVSQAAPVLHPYSDSVKSWPPDLQDNTDGIDQIRHLLYDTVEPTIRAAAELYATAIPVLRKERARQVLTAHERQTLSALRYAQGNALTYTSRIERMIAALSLDQRMALYSTDRLTLERCRIRVALGSR